MLDNKEITMSKYIVVTKSLWTETDLVEANSKAEAFQKVIEGDTLNGYGEGERPQLISTKKLSKEDELCIEIN